MAGRPRFRLAANKKDVPSGSKKEYKEIGAAWPNDYGGFNFRLSDGVLIRLPDGTIVNGGDWWFSLFDNENDKKKKADDWGDKENMSEADQDFFFGAGSAPADAPSPEFGDPGPGDDDIPF